MACIINFKLGNKVLLFFALLVLQLTFNIDNCISQWEPDVRLTNALGSSVQYNRCVAVFENVVHTVWEDERDGNDEIYYKHSTDGGTTWGADMRLTNEPASSFDPSIAVSGSFVHVVWYDRRNGWPNEEIYYKRSTDGGTTWGTDIRLTNDSAFSNDPSIAVFGSQVNVVWRDYRSSHREIYYKRSTDGGTTWGTDSCLTNNAYSFYPRIAASGSTLHVVWNDTRDNIEGEIYYKRSTDGGTNWGADTRLTNDPASSLNPSIAISGSNVYVVWDDYRNNNYEIFYKRSTDLGIAWGTDIRLTNNPYNSNRSSISVSDSNVHIVWIDERDFNTEVYYKRSGDGGITWGADTRLTYNTSYSSSSCIAVSGSTLHVVWNDNRNSNYEIYYKRNPTGNLTRIVNNSTELPSAIFLSQNFPNPFNPVTNIKYGIPKNSFVILKVYDLMGREVKSLVNEMKSPGNYSVDFNGSDLTSGVYFYKIQAGDFTETKRMMLIK